MSELGIPAQRRALFPLLHPRVVLSHVEVGEREIYVSGREIWIHVDRLLELIDRLFVLTCIVEAYAQIRIEVHVQGIGFQGAPELLNGFVVSRKIRKKKPVPLMGRTVVGFKLGCMLELPLSIFPSPVILVDPSQYGMRF